MENDMGIYDETKTGQDFEKTLVDGTKEELDALKVWLFKENIRLETEKKEFVRLQEKFLKEKQQFQTEMATVNRKLVLERTRLKQDELFFEKKMDILKNGFIQLEEERKEFERAKVAFDNSKQSYHTERNYESNLDAVKLLFKGVKSQLALKKRYRDLIKMFHPDNIAGDHEMVLLINAAYEELKRDYDFGRRA